MKYATALFVLLSIVSTASAQVVKNFNAPFGPTGAGFHPAECAGDQCDGLGVEPVSGILRFDYMVDARFGCQNTGPSDATIVFGANPDLGPTFNCYAGLRFRFPSGAEIVSRRIEFRPVFVFLRPLGVFDSGTLQFGLHGTEPMPASLLPEFATGHPLGIEFERFGASCVSGPGNMMSSIAMNAGGTIQCLLELP